MVVIIKVAEGKAPIIKNKNVEKYMYQLTLNISPFTSPGF